jgi:two-component system, chemotaxis family, protein-glutamate methylesterase/glutaminase
MSQGTDRKQSGFAGTLKNLQLIDIIQLCCLSVSTLAINVTKEQNEGTIYIQNGEVVHAHQSTSTGMDAFYTIMGWDSGIFETFDVDEAPERTIHEHYQFLLMEASRRIDETTQPSKKEAAHLYEKKLRVLIVDDSPIMTKILSSVYTARGDIEIAGIARNGEQAIAMIDKTKPDLITLDVNMPVMDGSTALKHIMIKKPCPVVVMSSLGEASQSNVLKFLDLGAVDFMSKPVRHKNILLQQEKMIQRLRRCAASNIQAFRRTPLPKMITADLKLAPDGNSCSDLIIINCGAGAPAAMLHLLNDLAEKTSGPIVLLQSLPPDLIPPLADFMDHRSRYHIVPVKNQTPLENNNVYVSAAGIGIELTEEHGAYALCPNETTTDVQLMSGFDRFLTSVSQVFTGRAHVVLLSGADIESLDGLEMIANASGTIVIQDRSTCIMPGSLELISNSHLKKFEIPPADIGEHFLKTRN